MIYRRPKEDDGGYTNLPVKVHETWDSVVAEAKRLATKHSNTEFVILEAVGTAICRPGTVEFEGVEGAPRAAKLFGDVVACLGLKCSEEGLK